VLFQVRHVQTQKEAIVNRLIRWPTLLGGIVMTAVLVPLAPTSSNRAQAQISVQVGSGAYYNPYGQGPYGGYAPGYGRVYGPGYGVPISPGQVPVYRGGVYAYPNYTTTYYRSGYGYGYRSTYYGRQYNRTLFYQPSIGPVYVPFGYRPY
jgi:hypothetical protein